MNDFYLTVVLAKHGDESPDTWIIKRCNAFNSFEPRFFAKDGRFGNKNFTLYTQEFKTKAEAEFVMESLEVT